MSNIQDAMNLLFPAHRQQVLAALLLEPGRSLHLRELARLVGSHAGTLAREVDKLTQAGLLLRTDQGNQAHYRANAQHPLFPELAALLRKTHGVVPALRTALQPLADRIALAFVYGSVASGTASEHSDVDVLLVGTADFVAVVQALGGLQYVFILLLGIFFSIHPTKIQVGEVYTREVIFRKALFVTVITTGFLVLFR